MQEIRADGFEVHAQVAIDMPEDTLFATAQAIGSGIVSLSHALDELRPDFLVVYADRFEGFAAVVAGTQMGIPTAHVEGGDYTEGGALDDSVRHAMTKLAHLHFTTNEQAAERVRRLGEEPWRVFNIGFPALDLVAVGNYAGRDEVYRDFGPGQHAPGAGIHSALGGHRVRRGRRARCGRRCWPWKTRGTSGDVSRW